MPNGAFLLNNAISVVFKERARDATRLDPDGRDPARNGMLLQLGKYSGGVPAARVL
jgi:hypothetical protein